MSAIITAVSVVDAGHHIGRLHRRRQPLSRPSPSSARAIVAAIAFVNVNINAGTCNHIIVINALCT
jgi:hypothetical protein